MLNFLPRDEKYFEQFTQMARRIHESARTLDRFFIGETTVSAAADHIKRLEHECDEISHEILRGIDRTFITPIDREDIHQLAVRLDDVIDLVDGTIRRVVLFKIIEPTDLSKRLSAIVVQATSEMVDAVADLRKQKGVVEHCIRIKQYENEGDVAYHEAVASLFTGSIEAIEVIKWKDIYDNLERTIDQCAAVAQMLESVILKHS
jgi:predicted phosphate transport protein (TIGR00153 family)